MTASNRKPSGVVRRASYLQPPLVFLLDDDVRFARALVRQLRSHGAEPVVAHSLNEAHQLLDGGLAPACAILDYELPDGTGLDLVARLRERDPLLPALLLTAMPLEKTLVNAAQAHGVMFAQKPLPTSNLEALLHRADAAQRPGPEALRRFLADKGLSPRQHESVLAAYASNTRAEAARRMSIGEETFRSTLKTALRKCGVSTLHSLTRAILYVGHRAASEERSDVR